MHSTASISFGYDFEGIIIKRMSTSEKSSTQISLDIMKKIVKTHTNKKSHFTIFALGKMAEEPRVFEYLTYIINNDKYNRYVDLQQHGYSHILVKKHFIKGNPVSPKIMDEEISKTNKIIKEIKGENPIGIRIATGFYNGLKGEKERLEILRKNGIKFVSSDLRGPNDQYPAPWKNLLGKFRQPYFYEEEGFPEMLEIPTQGTIDVLMKGISKLSKTKPMPLQEELKYYITNIDYASKNHLNYSLIFHPWAIAYNDKNLFILNKLLNYISKKGIPILSYFDIYQRLK